jgi:hypothetical protein
MSSGSLLNCGSERASVTHSQEFEETIRVRADGVPSIQMGFHSHASSCKQAFTLILVIQRRRELVLQPTMRPRVYSTWLFLWLSVVVDRILSQLPWNINKVNPPETSRVKN